MARVTLRSRSLLARLLVAGALLASPVAVAGCGNSGLGGIVLHHILNRLAPGHRRLFDKAFCIYHVDRAFHDFTHHHAIFGAFNAYEALKNCERGFAQ